VIAMSVPESPAQDHLQTLSELAELFSDEAFRTALRAADLDGVRSLLLGAGRGGVRGEAA
jgi:hypothetical protein